MNFLLILTILGTVMFTWLSGYCFGRAVELRRKSKDAITSP